MYCIKCGNKIDEGAKFCSKCGNKVGKSFNAEEIVNVSKNKLDDVASFVKEKANSTIEKIDEEKINNFVNDSKSKINDFSNSIKQKTSNNDNDGIKHKLKFNKFVIIASILVLVSGGAYFRITSSSKPEKVIYNYIDSLSKGNFKKAFEYTNGKTIVGEDEFSEIITKIEDKLAPNMTEFKKLMSNIEINDILVINETKDICVLSISIGMDGDFSTETMMLIKEKNKWKINLDEENGTLTEMFGFK